MLEHLLEKLQEGGDKLFYKIGEEKITYKECARLVLEEAEKLRAQKTNPVVLAGGKEISHLVRLLACVAAGSCYVPVDSDTPPERLKEIKKCLMDIRDWKAPGKENDIAYIIFTSGTTGNPKGVPISYSNLNHFLKWVMENPVFSFAGNVWRR